MAQSKTARARMRVERIDPILSVRSLQASLRFYEDVLGFDLDWQAGGAASVSRDDHAIMMIEGKQGHAGTWIWIGVEDIEPLHRDLMGKGVKLMLEPTNFSWAYELRVQDPDGHVLRFGAEPKSGRPFADQPSA
jgi:catechol 2,3-dioxygenase-like lactoylglutathione lyase family enzyme